MEAQLRQKYFIAEEKLIAKACCPKHPNGKTVGISGADHDEIKQQIPSVEAWLGRKYRRDLGQARPE
ncbi:uncharacterized protein ACA1_035790, partial [Acanthamoeba castellanii str. Neff]